MSDALQVGREIEFHLWYVPFVRRAPRAVCAQVARLHFRNQKEWLKFLDEVRVPAWVHSFASRDDLFLELKAAEGGFDSQTLAHETTHAIVARIYGNRHWPLWLSEGFAEYMGEASVAARNSRSARSSQRKLQFAEMSVEELSTPRVIRRPRPKSRVSTTPARSLCATFSISIRPNSSRTLSIASWPARRQVRRSRKFTAPNSPTWQNSINPSVVSPAENAGLISGLQFQP